MKGTYNNQNRKSGGYPKTKIPVGKKVGGQSLPCDEKRHADCDGYLTYFPHLKGYACQCDCHKKAKVTTKVEPTVGGWDKTHKPVIEAMKKIGYGLLKDGETFYQLGYELEPRQSITFTMSQAYVIASSVQEAKAEEREKQFTQDELNIMWIDYKSLIATTKIMNRTVVGDKKLEFILDSNDQIREEILKKLDLLSTLTTKETK